MANADYTHTVAQKGLYFRVDGEMKELPVGYRLKLNKKQAAIHEKRGMIVPITDEETADLSGGENAGANEELQAKAEELQSKVEELQKQLDEANGAAETAAAEAKTAAEELQKQLDEAGGKVTELTEANDKLQKELDATKKLLGNAGK